MDIKGFSDRAYICFDSIPDLNHLIIHVPLGMLYLDLIYASPKSKNEFTDFVDECIKISNIYNSKITILGHIKFGLAMLKQIGFLKWMASLLNAVDRTGVDFYLENGYMDFERKTRYDAALAVVDEFGDEKLGFCLDICHLRASINMSNGRVDHNDIIGNQFTNSLKQIHFSYTANNDGYFDVQTHGRVHPTIEDCLIDIEYLKSIGVDIENTPLITEIKEVDYVSRLDQRRELEYLHEINKD